VLLTGISSQRKEAMTSVPFCFLLIKMSHNSIDDVLVFDARDNSDRSTAATTNCNIDADGRPIDTRLSRWAQDIATRNHAESEQASDSGGE